MSKRMLIKIAAASVCTSIIGINLVPVWAMTKEETVYSKINLEGEVYSSKVSTHLINEEEQELIQDMTDLLNIQNTNGEEEYVQEGDSLVWKADGKDIYYEGDLQKELPIETKVSYTLDGKEISARELAGKSGDLSIQIEYQNKDAHEVTINGQKQTIYTPFVVVAGTIFNNEKVRDIQISNGKVVDNGQKSIVMGLAFPGLQESLDLPKDEVEIPNSITITAKVTDFEMDSILSFVTPKVLEQSDLESFDKMNELYAKVDELQSASKQLQDGASSLKSGTEEYTDKSQEFSNAMKQVANGVDTLNSNYGKISDGIAVLNQSSKELENGASSISEGTKAVESNLNVISEKLEEAQAGSSTLLAGQKKVGEGINRVISSLQQTQQGSSEQIKNLEALISGNQEAKKNLQSANQTIDSQIAALKKVMPQTEEITTQINTLSTQKQANLKLIGLLEQNIKANTQTINSLKSNTQIEELKKGLTSLEEASTKLETGAQSLNEGLTELSKGSQTLAQKSSELSQGASTLKEGTAKLGEGTKSLAGGSSQVKSGLNKIDDSTKQLTQANTKLVDGASTIQTGATQLYTGIETFNQQGINEICNYINHNVKSLQQRIEKLTDLADEYDHFTMLNEESKGNVKFILMIDGIKKENGIDDQKAVVPDNQVGTKEEKEDE